MCQQDPFAALVQQFEDEVWKLQTRGAVDPVPPCWEARWETRCQAIHVTVADVLREQSDETLTICLRCNLFVQLAFVELLVTRYGELLLFWFTNRFRAQKNDADDCCQIVYLKFYKRWPKSYDPEQDFQSYLYSAARNTFVEEVRRHRPNLALHLDELPGKWSVVDEVTARELEEQLEEAIACLPVDQRGALELKLAELSNKEIAERLDKTVQRVNGLLFKARRQVATDVGIVRPKSNRGRKPKPKTGPAQPDRVLNPPSAPGGSQARGGECHDY